MRAYLPASFYVLALAVVLSWGVICFTWGVKVAQGQAVKAGHAEWVYAEDGYREFKWREVLQ
jgi:hypothetical protein